MKTLTVPKVTTKQMLMPDQASGFLEKISLLQPIDSLNWKAYPYKPEVKFGIAHTGNEIWLKYYVREKYIRALEIRTNGDVYKDSTVEFFIEIDRKNYYNFEFSCIGTIHLSHGPGRGNRTRISPEIAEEIRIKSSLGKQAFEERTGDFRWEMMICIPIECFVFDSLNTFDGLEASANFYKCGDATTEPHFISWNPIVTPAPDYHRPEFFGKLNFGK